MQHQTTSRPQAFARLAIAAGLLTAITLASCKKEQVDTAAGTSKKYHTLSDGAIDAARVDTDIKNFYQKMKSLKTGSSSENIAAGDALFLIEGTYNKYVAERQFNCDVVPYEFAVKVPVNADGTLSMKNVSTAFYAIKDSMLAQKNRIGGREIGVESFDLDLGEKPTGPTGVNDGYISFNAVTIYKRPNPGFPIDMSEWCNDNFHEEATHVWKSVTQTLLTYPGLPGVFTTGQAKIDHTTKMLVPGTEDTLLPGAAPSLRAKGVGNYQKLYCKSMTCGYFVNVTPAHDWYASSVMPAPNEYASMGIPYYNSDGSWRTRFANIEATDPYHTYRHWLTTPMMNFYLGNIPAIITANIAPGKTFANFHIFPNGTIQSNYIEQAHYYWIYSGNFIPTPGGDCTGKLELGYL